VTGARHCCRSGASSAVASRADQHESRTMDEQLTLRILALALGSVVLACFVLGAVSLPH
jgi:hypothetical protein